MDSKSEMARIREQIALEYQAAARVFTDFTETARHEYISKRQKNIAACFNELKQDMSPEQAMELILEGENAVGVGDVKHETSVGS